MNHTPENLYFLNFDSSNDNAAPDPTITIPLLAFQLLQAKVDANARELSAIRERNREIELELREHMRTESGILQRVLSLETWKDEIKSIVYCLTGRS